MSDLSTFAQYSKLADLVIEKASKEEIAEAARLLAMNVAHYQSKFGQLRLDETLAMISTDKANDEQLQLMRVTMKLTI